MLMMMLSLLWSHEHIVVVMSPWHSHASSLASCRHGTGHVWLVVIVVLAWLVHCVVDNNNNDNDFTVALATHVVLLSSLGLLQ